MNDLALLPPSLAAKSLSPVEIVLPYNEAIQAVENLAAQGYIVFTWEGWINYPDGSHGHSGQHQGTREFWGTNKHSVQERIEEAAAFAQQTITQSQQQWNHQPEIAGATLYFCLSISVA